MAKTAHGNRPTPPFHSRPFSHASSLVLALPFVCTLFGLLAAPSPAAAQAPAAGAEFRPLAPGLEDLRKKYLAEKPLEPAKRLATIHAIGAVFTPEAAELLRLIWSENTELAIRVAVASALGTQGLPESFQTLEALFVDTKPKDDATLRASIARALGAFHTREAFRRLEAIYRDAKREASVRLAVATAIRDFPEADLPKEREAFFVAALDDDSVFVQAEALRFLAPRKDPRAAAVARELLAKDPVTTQPVQRQAAIEPLKQAGGAEAFLALFDAAGRETDEATKRLLLAAMATFHDPAVLKWIQAQGLAHPDPAIRRVAVALLGREGGKGAVKTLLAALRDPDAGVCRAAIDGLVEAGAREAAEDLLKLASAPDPDLAAAALEALGTLGAGNAHAVEKLVNFLKSPSPDLLLAAANALGRLRAVEALEPLLPLLDHATWQVRAAAIEALYRLRRKEAIPAFIARLPKEDGRLRNDLATALRRLTGMKLGYDARAWQAWWEDNKDKFELPAAEPKGLVEAEDGTTYYGIPVVSKRLAFLLDISGSMNAANDAGATKVQGAKSKNTRLDTARKELSDTLERLARDVRFNVICFDDRQEPWEKELKEALPAAKEAARKFLDRQRPRGGTNIYDPLETALADPAVDTVFLLSDGAPSAGKFVQPTDILREIRKLNRKRKVVLHTICIGGPSPFMESLAKENGGTYIQR